jgi:hypothetical protein
MIPTIALASALLIQGSRHDNLGARVAPLNDVDGDHCADFALDDGYGRAWVISGKTGAVIAHMECEPPLDEAHGVIIPLFGDADGDGAWDLIEWHTIRDLVLRSGKDLHVILDIPAPSGQDGFIGIPAAAGDWNKDGVPDVAAPVVRDRLATIAILSGKDGSVLHTFGGDASWSKRLYLHHGRFAIQSSCRAGDLRPASFVLTVGCESGFLLFPHDRTDHPIELTDACRSLWVNAGMGFVGDVDGDSYPDLVVSTYAERSNTKVPLVTKRGVEEQHSSDFVKRVVIVSGRTGADLEVVASVIAGEGLGAARIGDLDGDGIDEILLGEGEWPVDEALILSGKDRKVLWTLSEDSACCAGSCRFGANVAALGDVDGDGVADFAITSSSGVDQLDPGCVAVYSGKTRKRVRSIWKADLISMERTDPIPGKSK